MITESIELAAVIAEGLRARNPVSRRFFAREANRLAEACREMSERFRRGGRILAFGRGQAATDAQHVSVEFVHPVIVGKRALPALDLSPAFESWVPAIVRADDMVMAFGAGGDPAAARTLAAARRRGAMTFALPGQAADYSIDPPAADPFVTQELIEVLYHTLWETVHVFLEHCGHGHDVGDAGFLYPYLGQTSQDTGGIVSQVADSIRAKAETDERLREAAADASGAIAEAVRAMRASLDAGGTLLMFGNGGSATDANDWALDAVSPLNGKTPVPAISLAMDPASLSAVANDIGAEAIFLRQLIAHGRPGDIAIAISTSGGSRNLAAALEDARRRGLATVALLGYDGGDILRRGLADHAIVVHCDYIPRIQEVQASIYHVMMDAL